MQRIERMLEPLQTATAELSLQELSLQELSLQELSLQELSLQELSLQLNRRSDSQDVQRVLKVRHVEFLVAHPKEKAVLL